MHMADALLSPVVGGAMWAATGALVAHAARKVEEEGDASRVPLMGALGAFVFAAQMINFSIPGTGSSGHLGGGLLLAALLGPNAAFLVISSVLVVQALFFADGGLLALGCNIFNLGFFPCFVAYPLIYRPIASDGSSPVRVAVASTLAAVAGLQLGALSVVLETTASGITSLPFGTFVLLMLPIHLAIGLVEGAATTLVLLFARRARIPTQAAPSGISPLVAGLLAAAVVTGGALSWFASQQPDGLEWAMLHTSGEETLAAPEDGVHGMLAGVQQHTSLLPDYALPAPEGTAEAAEDSPAWPAVDGGTSLAGIVGGALAFALAFLAGTLLRRRSRSA